MKIIREIKLWWLQYSKKNTSSIQTYYNDKEWWYWNALTAIGYGPYWSPEGFPKRQSDWFCGGFIMIWNESNKTFYDRVIEHIKKQGKRK